MPVSRHGKWGIGLGLGLGLIFACASGGVAQVTVRGVVIDGAYGTEVPGATVRVDDRSPYITETDGTFQFTELEPGVYTITVEALGYRRHEYTHLVRGDTLLRIELEIDPVRLDALRTRGGNVDIRGTIRDRLTGERLSDGLVFVSTGQWESAKSNGSFKVARIPRGRRVLVDVGALGYMPERIALVTERDTTLDVRLVHDSVGIRRMDIVAEILDSRSRSVAESRYVFDRERLAKMSGWTIGDVLQSWGFGRPGNGCLFVDERPMMFGDQVRLYLETWFTQDMGRIEVYDRGGMVRLYTRKFLSTRPGFLSEFAPIIYSNNWGMFDTCT